MEFYTLTKICLVGNDLTAMLHFRGWFIKRLKLLGYQVDVIAPHKSKMGFISRLIRLLTFQVKIINAGLFDKKIVFFSYTLFANFFTAVWCMILRRRHIVVVTGGGSFMYGNTVLKQVFLPLCKFFFRSVDQFLFMNQANMEYYQRTLDVEANRCGFLPGEGINLEFCDAIITERQKVTRFDLSKFNVVYVGRLIKDKGIFDLVSLAKQSPGVNFNIYGLPDDNNPTSLSDAQLSNLANIKNLHFMGHTGEVSDVISQADLVLLPSYHEGFPTILSEAIMLGKEILTTDAVGCLDFVEYTRCGRTFAVGDIEDAKKKLDEIKERHVFYDSEKTAIAKSKVSIEAVFKCYDKVLKCI
jgi:glycosyltransferase involved in cell wall biosynthesis